VIRSSVARLWQSLAVRVVLAAIAVAVLVVLAVFCVELAHLKWIEHDTSPVPMRKRQRPIPTTKVKSDEHGTAPVPAPDTPGG